MSLENITTYESAAVAAMNLEKKPGLALTAMKSYYAERKLIEDPIIIKSLKDAEYGVANGLGISDSGVIQSAVMNSKRYEEALKEIKVIDALNYLGQGYEIPKTVVEGLLKYKHKKISELKDKNAQNAIGLLQARRLGYLGSALEIPTNDQMTTQALLQLYPEEER